MQGTGVRYSMRKVVISQVVQLFRVQRVVPPVPGESVHKYLRIRDLCKEMAFGSQHAGGECRSSYNSFEFNVLCRQFLESAGVRRDAGFLAH